MAWVPFVCYEPKENFNVNTVLPSAIITSVITEYCPVYRILLNIFYEPQEKLLGWAPKTAIGYKQLEILQGWAPKTAICYEQQKNLQRWAPKTAICNEPQEKLRGWAPKTAIGYKQLEILQ